MWKEVPLPRLIYKTDEAQVANQLGARLVNAYIDELGHIRKRPGLSNFVDLGTGKVQGLFWWDVNSVLIAVVSGNIYKITTSNGNFSDITGDTLNNTNIVRFATDGSTLVMANGSNMVTYDNTGTTADMVDTDAPTSVNNVAWIDGYMLADDTTNRGRVFFSSNTDITSWAATDFFTAETNPDDIQFMDTKWREVTMFGKEGIDIYYNDGITPFVRLDGAYIERGNIAKDSVQLIDSIWYWLDDKRRTVAMIGRTAQTVSTPFDNEIRDITPVSSADSMEIDYGTRKFYILSFPDDDKTFAYDASTQGWAEWGSWNGSNKFTKLIGITSEYAKAWDLTLVGDRTNGKVYKVDNQNFQDNGSNIRTLIRTGHIDHGIMTKKKSNQLRFKLKRGTGGLTTNPQFSLRWRSDNGAWSNWIAKDLGRSGDNEFFTDFNRMGMYTTRQYEIQHADNSDFILTSIWEDIEDLRR